MDSTSGKRRTPFESLTRAELWRSLWQEQQNAGRDPRWDMVIVGGGITGMGILREAARRGLKVLLLEQEDFAWGTSSRSSKMVHGGLRYLAMGDFRLARQALLERERLLREAPSLVERMGYFFLLNKKKSPPRWAVTALLWLYDRMAGIRNHRFIAASRLATCLPGIAACELKGAFYYTDAVTDDARLVLRVLQEAQAAGAKALNYVRVQNLIKKNNQIEGVTVFNTQTGESLEVYASLVVNATGAWGDRLRNQVNAERRIRPLRGSHIVIPAFRLRVAEAIAFRHPGDGRAVFVFPWENVTVVGTTDLDHRLNLDIEASISREEVAYLLASVGSIFPDHALMRDDILSTWAGVRPVIGSEKNKAPSRERRDHAVWRDGRLITVSGGKLTTFRLIALDVMAAASDMLPLAQRRHDIEGGRVFGETRLRPEQLLPNHPRFAEILIGRYGDAASRVVAIAANEEELDPIGETRFCLAECRRALRCEQVVNVDDLLLRRTRLGLLLPLGGAAMADVFRALFAQELGWCDTTWQAQWQRYLDIWQRAYSLPEEV